MHEAFQLASPHPESVCNPLKPLTPKSWEMENMAGGALLW